jgi:ribonuclease E
MRDDSRPTDAFAWTRPWVPYGDDPFVWYDPAEDLKRPVAPPANDRSEAPRSVAAEAVEPAPAVRAESGDEMWVELPAAEERPSRSRRSRGRGRGRGEPAASDETPVQDAVAPTPEIGPEIEAVPEPEPEPAPEPVVVASDAPVGRKPRASRAKPKVVAVEAVATPEPAPEPVLETVAAAAEPPPAPRAPDPAEIAAPPVAPRKGWWRR